MGAPPCVDMSTLSDVFIHMKGRVKYILGAKAPSLTCDTSAISVLDCSGFSRFAVARASDQDIILPQGSQAQLGACARRFRRLAAYANVEEAANDPSRLFIAFLAPAPGAEWPRHVWLVYGGMTMECCGGLGVASRPWNTRALSASVNAFEVPVCT